MNISNSLLDSLLALNLRYKLVLIGLLAVCGFEPALASRCDAHFPLDGTLADATGNGYNGMMIAEGDAGEPQFGEGKYGQALHLTGNAAMRAFLDLHHETCQQFTITAWFKLPSVGVGGPQTILSTGARGGIPAVVVSGSTLMLYGKGNGLWQKDAIRDGNTWFFVAATFDYEAGIYKLYWRNRPQDGKLSETPYDAEDSFWIGARSDDLRYMAQDLYVDDVRVYGRVLNLDEIRDASRNAVAHDTAQTQTTVSAITDASSLVPGPVGNQTRIEIPEDAVGTRPPLGSAPVSIASTDDSDGSSPSSSPVEQIADPEFQAVIYGKVLDGTGAPVPNLGIWFRRPSNSAIKAVRTGDDGSYAAAVFANEDVYVRPDIRNDSFPFDKVANSAKRVKPEPGKQYEVNFDLVAVQCVIEGEVTHVNRQRLPGMRVSLHDPDSFDDIKPSSGMVSTTTDMNGTFRFEFTNITELRQLEPAWRFHEYSDGYIDGNLDLRLHVSDPTGSYEQYGDPISHRVFSGYSYCEIRNWDVTMNDIEGR